MKKIFSMLLIGLMVVGMLAGCSIQTNDGSQTQITLWTYPIGGWGDQAKVDSLLEGFLEANPDIKVTVEYLTYTDGDNKVNTAIEGNAAPDLIMEGPERLVANWGAKGKMVNIADLFTDKAKQDLNAAALAACFADANTAYEYPLVMTAHCMAINKTVFEAAGAMQYLDAEKHTWTTENFLKAMDAVYAYTNKQVGAVFCAGQGGDQGTRALVNNLYGGTFTNAAHTEYTWGDAKNIQALTTLKELHDKNIVKFDAGIVGGDEIKLFRNGTLNVAFCWNIGEQLNNGRTDNGDEIMFMSFPSENGNDAKLQGGIWGFGIFDNGDDAKIAAAKKFIQYMCDSEATAKAVQISNFFPANAAVTGVYAGTENEAVMNEYNILMPMLGDYYQVTTNWAEARTQWWNMLQDVGEGADIADTVASFVAKANGK